MYDGDVYWYFSLGIAGGFISYYLYLLVYTYWTRP